MEKPDPEYVAESKKLKLVVKEVKKLTNLVKELKVLEKQRDDYYESRRPELDGLKEKLKNEMETAQGVYDSLQAKIADKNNKIANLQHLLHTTRPILAQAELELEED